MRNLKYSFETLEKVALLKQKGHVWGAISKHIGIPRKKLKDFQSYYRSSAVSFMFDAKYDKFALGRKKFKKDFPYFDVYEIPYEIIREYHVTDGKTTFEVPIFEELQIVQPTAEIIKKVKTKTKPKKRKTRKTKPKKKKSKIPYVKEWTTKTKNVNIKFHGDLYTVPKVIRDEWKKIAKLMNYVTRDYGRDGVDLDVKVEKHAKARSFGFCSFNGRHISMRPRSISKWIKTKYNKTGMFWGMQLLDTLIHELAHSMCPFQGHSPQFHSVYRDILKRYGMTFKEDRRNRFAQRVDWLDESRERIDMIDYLKEVGFKNH